MHSGKIRSEETEKKGSRSTSSEVPSECLDDPQFIKVLAPALCSEISTLELIVRETDADIEGFKRTVAKGLDERKRLKEIAQILLDKKTVLGTALESLEREGKLRSIVVATMKIGLDDATQREVADRAKYKDILHDYEETWQKYKAAYEKRPWAKQRLQAGIVLKQYQLRLMMAEYEKEHLKKMVEQRKEIDEIRVKVSIVEMSEMILQRWEEQKHIEHLNTIAKQLQNELNSCTDQLLQLKRDEEERKKRAEIETATMPPPTLDFSFMRSIYHEERNLYKRNHPKFTPIRDSDTISINTLMLEEMCSAPINDQPMEIYRSESQRLDEDEEELLDVSVPVSNTQEFESNNTIVTQVDKTLDSYMTNQSAFQTKLEQLCIEKTATRDNKQVKKQVKSKKKDNHENSQSEVKDHKDPVEESHQRTRRWCEDSQQREKFAPFLSVGQRSNSFDDQTKVGFLDEVCDKSAGQKFGKASSISGSESGKLHQRDRGKNLDKVAMMEITDETSEGISLENFVSNVSRSEQTRIQNAPIAVEASRTGERDPLNKSSGPPMITPGNQDVYEVSRLKRPVLDDNTASQESKTSEENSELSIDMSCSKPKIRKIETVNYTLEQRANNTVATNEPLPPRMPYSPRQYVPSRMGSDLSTMFASAMQDTPQGSFAGEATATPGFRPLSNWKNWSPPISERSFASSISKIGPNKEKNEENNSSNQQSQPFDIGGFFTMKPSQNPTMF